MENSAKILLLGKTGVGKSSFINYFLGKTVAKAAAGKPVTTDYFISYEIEDGRYPVEIFDTKGLEAIGAHNQLHEIINGIKQRNNSNDIFNWFHTIFYCVSMSKPRFEDFEASFVHRLQQELTQHIHVIITQCDTAKPESIANMRRTISEKLGNTENIEFFEVVSVSMKKRNGQVVESRGKEEISERVFDLLLEDISYKLSSDYAKILWNSLVDMIDGIFYDLDSFIDKTVKLKTLGRLIMDADETMDSINTRMDELFERVGENMEIIQKQTDERFMKILRPAAQLYNSYWGVVTNSYVENAGLAFSDASAWMDTDWMDEWADSGLLMAKMFPKVGRYMDGNGELPDDSSIFELLGIIGAGVGDLFSLKKNLKRAMQECKWRFIQGIPSQDEIQAKAYERIVEYMKPDIPPV